MNIQNGPVADYWSAQPQITRCEEHEPAKAFGFNVKENQGDSLVAQEISSDELDSKLFKEVDDEGNPVDDFIFVINKKELLNLRDKSSDVFAGMYSAKPVEETKEGFISRLCTVVPSTLLAYSYWRR